MTGVREVEGRKEKKGDECSKPYLGNNLGLDIFQGGSDRVPVSIKRLTFGLAEPPEAVILRLLASVNKFCKAVFHNPSVNAGH